MSNPWFVPKTYGYGATPNTWQGWLVTAIMVAMTLATALVVLPTWGVLTWGALLAAMLIAFAAFVRWKTDGTWKWRWGGR